MARMTKAQKEWNENLESILWDLRTGEISSVDEAAWQFIGRLSVSLGTKGNETVAARMWAARDTFKNSPMYEGD